MYIYVFTYRYIQGDPFNESNKHTRATNTIYIRIFPGPRTPRSSAAAIIQHCNTSTKKAAALQRWNRLLHCNILQHTSSHVPRAELHYNIVQGPQH